MLKRILFSLILIGLSQSLMAAVYDSYQASCRQDKVDVPCVPKSWDVAVDLLIMNEWEGKSIFLTDVSPMVQVGFRLAGSYQYSKTNLVTLNWSRYDAKTGLGATLFENTGRILGEGTVNYRSHFDIVNLDMSQNVALGERMDWRAFAGIEYAYLADRVSAQQGILNAQQPTSWVELLNGVGPRVGTIGVFYLDEGVSVFAESAISVLSSKVTVNVSGGTVNNGASATDQGVRHMMVTQFETQIGMIYEKLIPEGAFSFRGGFESHNFINAVVNQGNMGWQGGFVGLKWLSLA